MGCQGCFLTKLASLVKHSEIHCVNIGAKHQALVPQSAQIAALSYAGYARSSRHI